MFLFLYIILGVCFLEPFPIMAYFAARIYTALSGLVLFVSTLIIILGSTIGIPPLPSGFILVELDQNVWFPIAGPMILYIYITLLFAQFIILVLTLSSGRADILDTINWIILWIVFLGTIVFISWFIIDFFHCYRPLNFLALNVPVCKGIFFTLPAVTFWHGFVYLLMAFACSILMYFAYSNLDAKSATLGQMKSSTSLPNLEGRELKPIILRNRSPDGVFGTQTSDNMPLFKLKPKKVISWKE